MSRYIDADDFLDLFYAAAIGQDKVFTNIVEMVLSDTPTADVVPVVRCNDCIFFNDAPNDTTSYCMRPIKSGDYEETGYSFPLEVPTAPYEFCSYGERMIYDGEIHRR